jgi:uncharacterized membrane protein YcjF (UPF0283 family)
MNTFKGIGTLLGIVFGIMAFGWIAEASTRTGVIGLIAVFIVMLSVLAIVLFMVTEEQ